MKGNINGRINLLYLMAWSVLGVLWCKIYVFLVSAIMDVLNKTHYATEITIICFMLRLYNCYISFLASYRQMLRRRGISPKNTYEEWVDRKYNDFVMKEVYANAKYVNNEYTY